jgi:hypothetical protein
MWVVLVLVLWPAVLTFLCAPIIMEHCFHHLDRCVAALLCRIDDFILSTIGVYMVAGVSSPDVSRILRDANAILEKEI